MEKIIQKVKKRYPDASVKYIGSGWKVFNGEYDIFEEYLFQPAASKEDAWNLALQACKITQNFNRTHPDKVGIKPKRKRRINLH